MNLIDERKQHILFAVIQEYAKNPTPVGSNTLVETYRLPYSPATVRGELAALEELGYLRQPHTSSGRVPSSRAYRYFVDTLIESDGFKREQDAAISRLVSDFASSEDLLSAVAHALSHMTNYLSLVSASQASDLSIAKLELISLHEQQLILVLVSSDEQVLSSMIHLEAPLSQELAQQISVSLDKTLRSCKLKDIERILQIGFSSASDLSLEDIGRLSILSQYDPFLLQTLIQEVRKLMNTLEKPQTTLVQRGVSSLLNHPEFQDIERMRPLIVRIEKGFDLREMFTEKQAPLVVSIAEETLVDELGQVSIIASPFKSSQGVGYVGVLGPIRMNYIKTMRAVASAASELSARVNE